MTEKVREIQIEPRSSIRPAIDELNKPESLEAQRTRLQKRWGKVKTAGAVVLLALAAKGGIDSFNDIARNSNNENQSEIGSSASEIANPFSNSAPETERSQFEKEIEEKYGIELLNQREGYERIGKEYDEENEELMGHRPVVRWNMSQLRHIDDAIVQFPSGFFPEVNGKKFAISLWDYPESEAWGGLAHWPENMVSVSENTFENSTNLGTLAHEGAHIKDLLVNDGSIGKKATEIIGYESFKDARLNFKPILDQLYEKKLITGDTYFKLNYGFMGYDGEGKDDPTEFIAVLAAKYIERPEEFNDLIEIFGEEHTKQLYDLVKIKIFDGREYGKNEQLDENQKNQVSEVIKEINENQHYEIINESENRISLADINNLTKILEIFPQEFFDNSGPENKFRIVLKDKVENDSDNTLNDVIITPESLRQEDPDGNYTYQLDAVRDINRVLIRRIDEIQGNKIQIKLVDLLGGEDAFRNPEKYFPKMIERNKKGEIIKNTYLRKDGSLRSPGKILSILSTYYLYGDYSWSRDTYRFGEKGREIYELMKEIYGGREYDGDDGYAPIPKVVE